MPERYRGRPSTQRGIMIAVDGYLDAVTYEARSGVAKAEFEERVRASVQASLADDVVIVTPLDGPARIERGAFASYGGTVESVVVEGSGSTTCVVVRFRMSERADRIFATRRRIWPVLPPDAPHEEGTPEERGAMLAMNLEEDLATRWWKWKDQTPDQNGLVWSPTLKGL